MVVSKAKSIFEKLANAAKVQENLKKGMTKEEAVKAAYPNADENPKNKGVIDPAGPEPIKEATVAKSVPIVGAATKKPSEVKEKVVQLGKDAWK